MDAPNGICETLKYIQCIFDYILSFKAKFVSWLSAIYELPASFQIGWSFLPAELNGTVYLASPWKPY